MPMPTGGAWPPPAHAPAYQSYADWDAWYDGRTDVLADVYRQRTTGPTPRIRPSQLAGGFLGMVSRWLWGNPPQPGQRDTRLHVPVPADLAAAAAGLLFSEPPTLTVEGADTQAAVEAMEEGGLFTVLRHAAEHASVLGDVYLRPVIDKDVSPEAAIATAVPADAAIPTIRWGRLVEVTFWSCLHDSAGTVVRLLEHHELVNGAGRIVYGLFQGTSAELGRLIPLGEHPNAAHLAELVDDEGAQATGLDRLDVVRVPNAGPQRIWRKHPVLKWHGRSDMDGNEPIFDRIDESWTSWMRDIRLGRGRLSVPSYMLENLGPGQGATWDADREVYSALNSLPDQVGAGTGLTVSQFAIRHAEHQATIDALMEAAMRHAGLSSQTLGEEGDVAMTATEAQARERRSYITRGDRIATWSPALADYVELHLSVEALNFRGPDPERPNVEFGDAVQESPETIARTLQLLDAAGAVSVETKVRIAHPDWDDDQVRAEVAAIRADTAATMPDPVDTLNSHAGNGNPAEGDQGAGDQPAE